MIHGRWTLLEEGKRRSLCVCICGTRREVRNNHLKSGRSASCGCMAAEKARKRCFKHGWTDTPEHIAWMAMKRRCYNTRDRSYKNYGGRGIKVFSIWRVNFQAFLAHIGKRPSPSHSVDRIDHNGHYVPGNVRWATVVQQNRNTRANRTLNVHGVTRTIAEWCDISGIGSSTLCKRIDMGWAPERAISQPVRVHQ